MSADSCARSQAIAADDVGTSTQNTPAAGAATAVARTRALARLASIDILRGLVIVIMALDHVRDYFTGVRFDPLDLTQTSPELFVTRWITHLCAPIFIFLAGVSAWLVGRRCTTAELSRFLFTRGLWLVALEFSVVNWGWTFSLDYEIGLFLQVIWAIGISMLLLAALVRLPVRWVGVIAVALIAGHNLLDGVEPAAFGRFALLWNLLHVPGPAPFGFVLYPIVPWVGVMALGYALGSIFAMDPARRRRIQLALGFGFIAAFVALRLLNGYGNPKPWSVQSSASYTFFSFMDVHKYPPSLLYVLATLGPGMLLLALFDSARGAWARVLEIFGRVPLFAYVLHIFVLHLAAGLVGLATGFGTVIITSFALQYPPDWGFGLVVVYLAWIGVMLVLYPMCRWFADLRKRRRDWWLSYL